MVTDLQPGEVVLALDTNEFGVKTSGGDMLWTATLDPQTGKLQQTDGLLQTSDRGAAGGVAALPSTLPAAGSLLQLGAGGTVQAATDASGAVAMSGGLPKMLAGSVQITPDAASTPKQVHIDFPAGYFSKTPAVFANAKTAAANNYFLTATNTTKDGVDIFGGRNTGTNYFSADWMAIQLP